MNPVIVCIAKSEHDYIEEFVKYHLQLGFKQIYLYDNEDIPTYNDILKNYIDSVTFIHFPFNNNYKGIQYIALDHFIANYLFEESCSITHVAHIDIDEFIVLKKHENITDFINDYIKDDCQGIGMNWRMFGSSFHENQTNEPITCRFTWCDKNGDRHIKTLFKKDYFLNFGTCHEVYFSTGYTKSTNGCIISGPFNEHIDHSIIQLNHYKCKTLPEFRKIRQRGRADFNEEMNRRTNENIEESFNYFNKNDIEDLTACNFYKKHCT